MIISGTNISTYGLRLLRADGFFNLPKRKDILAIPAFTANDIKRKSSTGTAQLYGRWDTITNMQTALAGLQSLIKSAVLHTIEIDEYDLLEFDDAVFKDGYTVDVIRTVATVTMKITVPDLILIPGIGSTSVGSSFKIG